jgi:SAM-dependent methyltransferase
MTAMEEVGVIAGTDIAAQLARLGDHHRTLFACVDPSRAAQWASELQTLEGEQDDFGPAAQGGRGIEYVRAQERDVAARFTGIRNLTDLARSRIRTAQRGAQQEAVLIDLLGGNGLISRACDLLGIADLAVLTCDASPFMVSASWAAGLPALLQRAERPLMRSSSVDVVLLAYGSHHIAPDQRAGLVAEAHRILRPGGVFLLHDFLVGSPMDSWFAEVVDPYSVTGHKLAHFTESEISGYLAKAGFAECEVLEVDDPYTVGGPTAVEAELRLGSYLLDMYGLVKADQAMGSEAAARWALERGKEIFLGRSGTPSAGPDVASYDETSGQWCATLSRRAVVGVGLKLI